MGQADHDFIVDPFGAQRDRAEDAGGLARGARANGERDGAQELADRTTAAGKVLPVTEDAYAAQAVAEVETLIACGALKENVVYGEGRAVRAERYARSRYRGVVAGEVTRL